MSGILLDTQAYLWFVTRSPRLTRFAHSLIQGSEAPCMSVASLWEIGIKSGLGKLDIDADLVRLIESYPLLAGIEILPVKPRHILRAAALPHHHGDPFDRMILATTLEEGLAIVSSDTKFDAYPVTRLF